MVLTLQHLAHRSVVLMFEFEILSIVVTPKVKVRGSKRWILFLTQTCHISIFDLRLYSGGVPLLKWGT